MKVTGKGCTLIGTEGSSPPLPHIEVSDSEGKALIGRGDAVEVGGQADEAEAPPASAEAEAVAANANANANTGEGKALVDDRAQLIADALHLVEPDGLEAKGARKGKPTAAAVQAITDLTDVTPEEIDAAVAAHEAP